MELNELSAISPVDGRYRKKVSGLDAYFSEYALMKYRVFVEVEYFISLAEFQLFSLDDSTKEYLRKVARRFSIEDAKEIKKIERTTNHDVKAVEYFLKGKLNNDETGEWIHFGLTSQDINNTAIPLSWKDAITRLYLPEVVKLVEKLKSLSAEWKDVSMLARTHGQPASPTKLGKEIRVFVERIEGQLALFTQIPYSAKFGGATGNFNAHHVAFPLKDWTGFANDFVEGKLGLKRSEFTTQIEHYDNLAAQFDNLKRINTILIDLCRDVWTYISMDYFKQKIRKGEIGSSAMPHKVNPIDFENAEGNFGLANAFFEHLSQKLPVSRLQRDLTDSTVLRNLGMPMAYTMISFQSLMKGLEKLLLNEEKLQQDLNNNWAVVAEAIQTILRRENYPKPYEALLELTRGKSSISKTDIESFINNLNLREEIKKELLRITPANYTGIQIYN